MEPEVLSAPKSNLKAYTYTAIFFAAVLLISYSTFSFVLHNKKAKEEALVLQEQNHKTEVLDSLVNNTPKPLQDSFLKSVDSGALDKYAKSAAYFIMHRYFDNKGNIYEIYDYSNSDPRLSFLKEAEQIYPDIFAKIQNKTLPTSFSEEGTYAYLAYLEALDKKGYTDVAAQGTAANQYAKMAYIGKIQSSDKDLKNLSSDQKRNLDKSMLFAKSAANEVSAIVDSKTIPDGVYVADVVIGLNQYAYALRHYKYFGIPFSSPKTPEEIFALTTEYTSTKVPELNMFTHLIDASSLALINGSSTEITKALRPFINYRVSVIPRDYSVVDRVMKARLGHEKEGVYSKENIISISKKSPDFKSWLYKAGWKDADFK
ncbi:MAG: hypothetical protein WC444_02325 [Candidatus Paceibacterota bacterium]